MSGETKKWPSETYTLQYPVTVEAAEKEITEITLREPNGRALKELKRLGVFDMDKATIEKLKVGEKPADDDVEEVEAFDVDQLMGVISILSKQPEEVVDEMHSADILAAFEVAAPLLEAAFKTSAN